MIATVEEFCPHVEVLRPGLCAINARGPARYFGGEAALASQILAAVTRLGCHAQARAGLADGLFAAQLAAQQAEPGTVRLIVPGGTPAFLAPQPVSVLGHPDLVDLLPRLGLRTLGEFAALPAVEAMNRFGTLGVLAHRLARGLASRPLAPRPLAADLSVSVEFDPPAEQDEPVVFAAKALAERMHTGLAARGLCCVRVRVQATSAGGQQTSQLWQHDGLLSALAVAERVRWQLASWRGTRVVPEGNAGLPGPDGIVALRLIPDQLVRDEGRQLGLWGETVVSDRVARAALRVQAMLGHGAVTRPVLAGGRGPAEQVTLVPFGDTQEATTPPDRPWPGRLPAPSPATVYPDPLPALITDDFGAAVTVTGRALISAPPGWLSVGGGEWLAVISWAGPWPVDECWWQPQRASRRARFQLVTADGSGWLLAVSKGGWLVEARYD